MAAGPSNPSSCDASAGTQEDQMYLYALNANVWNFVSVKLSNERNYHLWERQMGCLLKSYNVHGIVYGPAIHPQGLSPHTENRFDSLVKGWIFGSISEGLLETVVDLGSAKEVWDRLKSFYDPTIMSSQKVETRLEGKPEIKVVDKVSTEKITQEIDMVSTRTGNTEGKDVIPTENRTKDTDVFNMGPNPEDQHIITIANPNKIKTQSQRQPSTKIKGEDIKTKSKRKIIRNKDLRKAIVEGNWSGVLSMIKEDKEAITEAINSDGNTMLHIAVGLSRNNIVKEILQLIEEDKLPKMINLDGSTALHIAAIVGNKPAAELLVKENRSLLEISDHKGETPLDKAYENMHLDTIEYLLKAISDDGKTKKKSSPLEDSHSPGVKIGVNLLVNAVSAKQYDLATELIKKFPDFAVENDNVLMAIARTFPTGLGYGETLIYPIIEDNSQRIAKTAKDTLEILELLYKLPKETLTDKSSNMIIRIITLLAFIIIMVPVIVSVWIINLILLSILMVYNPFFMIYFCMWKIATTIVPPIKHIEKKKKEWEEAKEVLKLVCDEIDRLEFPDAHPRFYTRPILEAARQNAYEVVDEILMRSPEAIRYKDKSGYDIIQLAILHRSEKIYNLIYIIGERKSVYRMIEDSSKNNMLHLAGRLAPSHKLKLRTGAALQLQRELQWREEVKKLVFPAYITKENIFMETPDMVFTKEHANLVKEGEKWMKAVAESCSITAALITTIVFAAAITVPGGSNQNTGIPLFTEDIAFTIFAISDAVSLFASSTALLMFQSILTGRFSEQDFLVSLPRRLIVGLCTLMISTTAMMVAFSATLFLVFCHRKPWLLAPICVLAFLPIASFGTLQIPLIVDLFRSTYIRIFGKQSNKNNHRFNLDDLRLFFGK